MNPVALPPGWDRLSTIPAPTGSATAANTIGKVVGGERDQLRSIFCALVGIVRAPAGIDPHIMANPPTRFLQALVKRRKSVLAFWTVRSPVHEHANPPQTFRLLRVHY